MRYLLTSLLISGLIAFTSCKKDDDVVPYTAPTETPSDTTNQDNNGSGNTNTGGTDETKNTAPIVDGTVEVTNPATAAGTYNIADYVYDAENDNISVVSVTNAIRGTVTMDGSNITYTPKTGVWLGEESLTVTVTDGTNETSFTVDLSVGTALQIATYSVISPYLGKTSTGGQVSQLTFNADGTMSTNGVNMAFYGDGYSNGGTWTINNKGNVEIVTEHNGHIEEFTVVNSQITSIDLKFTRVISEKTFYQVY